MCSAFPSEQDYVTTNLKHQWSVCKKKSDNVYDVNYCTQVVSHDMVKLFEGSRT